MKHTLCTLPRSYQQSIVQVWCMVAKVSRALIGDFSHARKISPNKTPEPCPTSSYLPNVRAPELFLAHDTYWLGMRVSPKRPNFAMVDLSKCDLWALGCICMKILYGDFFQCQTEPVIAEHIVATMGITAELCNKLKLSVPRETLTYPRKCLAQTGKATKHFIDRISTSQICFVLVSMNTAHRPC